MAAVANPLATASLIVAWLDTQEGKRAGLKRIASAVGESRKTTAKLMGYLAAEGWVSVHGDQYALTAKADEILDPGRGQGDST